MVKKQKFEPDDKHLFRERMAGVTPLKAPATTESRAPRRTNIRIEPDNYFEITDPSILESADNPAHIDADDGSSHRKHGIQLRALKKLKRGRFTPGDELDLHNMTTATAHKALLEFIAKAQKRSLESVRIIHGKGLRSENGPRLKLLTRQILRQHPQVLAYVSCKPSDGGEGAVDILLKSS